MTIFVNKLKAIIIILRSIIFGRASDSLWGRLSPLLFTSVRVSVTTHAK